MVNSTSGEIHWTSLIQDVRQKDHDGLVEMADRIWPLSSTTSVSLNETNKAKWYRAVAVVRSTKVGWHLDKTVTLSGSAPSVLENAMRNRLS